MSQSVFIRRVVWVRVATHQAVHQTLANGRPSLFHWIIWNHVWLWLRSIWYVWRRYRSVDFGPQERHQGHPWLRQLSCFAHSQRQNVQNELLTVCRKMTFSYEDIPRSMATSQWNTNFILTVPFYRRVQPNFHRGQKTAKLLASLALSLSYSFQTRNTHKSTLALTTRILLKPNKSGTKSIYSSL